MSRKRRDREYLAYLAEAVQRIVVYTGELTYEEFRPGRPEDPGRGAPQSTSDGRGSEEALCPGKKDAPAPALETNGRDA